MDDDEALVRDEGQYDAVFLSDLDGRNGTRIVMQPGSWLRVAGRGGFNGDGAPIWRLATTRTTHPPGVSVRAPARSMC